MIVWSSNSNNIPLQYHPTTRTRRTKSMGVGDRVSVDDDRDSSESPEIPD